MSYHPLKKSRREIRLLHLLPGAKDDGIRCNFTVVSLDEAVEYEALSYVWGDATKTAPIEFESKIVPVTVNLHRALKSLRLEDRERVIWADALSINQNDLEERSGQVSLMAAVFSQAVCVIAYLGEAWDGCEMAMEAIRQIGENKALHLNSVVGPALNVGGLDTKFERLRKNLIRFFESPWWRRVWTVQEFLLAKDAVFQYGGFSLNASVGTYFVEHGHHHINTCCFEPPTNQSDRDLLLVLFVLVRDTFWGLTQLKLFPDVSFLSILSHFRDRRTADVRDKVYGFLGLANADFARSIRPDYTLTPEEVFQSAAVAQYNTTGRLKFLSYCYGKSNLDLPSWVPDWTSEMTDITSFVLRMEYQERFDACGSRVADMIVLPGERLQVTGLVVDSLDALMSAAPFTGNHIRRGYGVVNDAWLLAQSDGGDARHPWSTNRTTETDFWLTMIGGVWPEAGMRFENSKTMQQAHTIDLSHFNAWKSYLAKGDWDSPLAAREGYGISGLVHVAFCGRRFVRTAKGNIGVAPAACEKDDVVVVLCGERVPFILRPVAGNRDGEKRYTLIGDAYIHGIMNGEAFKKAEAGLEQLKSIVIV